MNSHLTELRQRARSLLRTPTYTFPAAGSLVLGTASGGAALALAWSGLSRVQATTAGLEAWELGWTDQARSAATLAAEGLSAVLRVTEVAGLLLLLALVVNLGLLVVARANGRRRELSLRVAVGTPPRRLASHLLVDSIPFGALAISLGVLLAIAALGVLRVTWPEALPTWMTGGSALRGMITASFLALAALAGLSLLPLRRLYRSEAHGDLQRDLRTGLHATAGPHEGIFREWLGTFTVAVSAALLIGAGSLLHGFSIPEGGHRDQAGIDRHDTLTLHLDLSASASRTTAPPEALQIDLLERLTRVPGVRAASISTPGSWLGLGDEDWIRAHCGWCGRGVLRVYMTQGAARVHGVSPRFFTSHGVRLIEGREFAWEDDASAPLVAVINRSFAYIYFPNVDPLSKPVQIGGRDGDMYTVVGIVDDITIPALGRGSDAVPALYLASLQRPPSLVGVALRTGSSSAQASDAVLAAIRQLDPGLAASDVMMLGDRIDRAADPLRWFGGIFGVIGVVALVLAVLGVFGTLSHNMSRRVRELGVRIALGAHPHDIFRIVLRQTSRIVNTGIWLGVLAGIGIARLLQVLFLGVRAVDLTVIAAVVAVVLAAALLATVGPTRLALKSDPMDVLRAE